MSCQVNFPLQDIVLLLREKISPEIIGAVPEEKLEEEVLSFIQPKIDELQEQLTKLPPEVHVVTQSLQGSVLEITLNNGKVLSSDLSPLFTKFNGLLSLYEKNVAAGAGANGWDASLVSYGEITQKQVNDGLESIDAMLAIKNPRHGQRVYVKSYHAGLNKGGGTFVYDAKKSLTNDGGVIINGWVRQLDSNEIDPVCFGAKAEFDGTNQATAFDDAPAIQATVKYLASVGGGRVIFGSGKYWLNSYQTEPGADGWNIINLRSNVSFEWKNNSQVWLGNYFHDKGFHLFSGIISNSPRLKNVHFIRPYITSLLEENYMETTNTRRVAIEMWHHENCTIFDGHITNMDLSNCIGTGVTAVNNPSKFALVKRMKFINVVYPTTKSINNDHTSIYLNSQNSSVDDCDFVNEGDKGWMIACPVELHESNTVFSNSRVSGYTRGGWFVGDRAGESVNQRITGITATVTNKGFNITCFPNAKLRQCVADNNVFYLKHPTNVRNDLYYGNQALFHIDDDSSPADAISDFVIKDNTVNYLNSTMLFFRTMFSVPHDVKNFIVDNNTFNGITGGLKVGDKVTNLDGWSITRNKFNADLGENTQEVFLDFSTTDKLTNFVFEDNTFSFFLNTPNYLVKVNAPNGMEKVRLGKIHGVEVLHPVKADYLFSNNFASGGNNYLKGTWYNLTLTIPQLAANEIKNASTNFDASIVLPYRSTAKFIAPLGSQVYLIENKRAYQGGVSPAVGNVSGDVYQGASLAGTAVEVTGLT